MVTVITDPFSKDGMLNMVFTTAMEGGINYWASVISYRWSDGSPDHNMIEEFEAVIVDDEGKRTAILPSVIRRGIRKAWANRHTLGDYHRIAIDDLHFGKYDDVDFDADTADIIVQYGLFGELVYG